MFPTLGFSTSCASTSIVDFLLYKNNTLVSFKVIDSYMSDDLMHQSFDIKITKEFISNDIENMDLTINSKPDFGPSLKSLPKDTEWLGVLIKRENSYSFALCAPTLSIENGNISGETGLDILDDSENEITLETFDLALNVYQQGLASADKVCQSSSPYCTHKSQYDSESGILELPSVSYYSDFGKIYTKATLKKTNDNPMTFTLIELNN